MLNNLLYPVSEMPIPLDEVDREATEKPEHWDLRFIRDFMLVTGPVSSIFDYLTFGLLLLAFHANEPFFQTGRFIESLATQVLVIFVLRSRRNPLRSHPHPLLAATSLAIVVIAVLLPFTPLGAWFGFVPPSAAFLLAIGALTVSYLLLAESAKQAFFRLWSLRGIAPSGATVITPAADWPIGTGLCLAPALASTVDPSRHTKSGINPAGGIIPAWRWRNDRRCQPAKADQGLCEVRQQS